MSTVRSVRLNERADRMVARLARRRGLSRSQIIREALQRIVGDDPDPRDASSAYAVVADLIGRFRSGRRSASERAGQGFRSILEDHRRRR